MHPLGDQKGAVICFEGRAFIFGRILSIVYFNTDLAHKDNINRDPLHERRLRA